MGTFNVDVTISPADFSAGETITALVDTGSTCSMAPASLLRRLGIAPDHATEFELAGGEVVSYETGLAGFSVEGRRGWGRVIFGPEGEYILGATALEDLALMVDPVNYRLVPTRMLLKGGIRTNGSRPR